MLNEKQLLKDIRNAENSIKETLEKLSKEYPNYSFLLAFTQDERKQMNGENVVIHTIDISCHLKKDF